MGVSKPTKDLLIAIGMILTTALVLGSLTVAFGDEVKPGNYVWTEATDGEPVEYYEVWVRHNSGEYTLYGLTEQTGMVIDTGEGQWWVKVRGCEADSTCGPFSPESEMWQYLGPPSGCGKPWRQ